MRDIFGNEHVTDKMCLNVLKSIFDVLQELIIRYGRYKEYTEPFSGEIYWKAFLFVFKNATIFQMEQFYEVIPNSIGRWFIYEGTVWK